MVGANNLLVSSAQKESISFLSDFRTVTILSFPHSDSVKFNGMREKSRYLIWRQKNGFFTALNIDSRLLTWSMASGHLLFATDTKQTYGVDVTDYEVYRSSKQDTSYC